VDILARSPEGRADEPGFSILDPTDRAIGLGRIDCAMADQVLLGRLIAIVVRTGVPVVVRFPGVT
jgi:hypothetical protein